MITVANRVFVSEAFAEEFEQRFRQRMEKGSLQQQDGFIRLQIQKPLTDACPYVVHTCWESREAFNAWVKSDDFAEAHRNPLPEEAFTQKGGMEIHEVVVTTE